jgi:hypothetical protein
VVLKTAWLVLACFLAACAGSQTRDDAQAEAYAPTPASILTEDRVDTRLGQLDLFDGFPSAETVDAVYDHLDFQRAVRAFLDTIPGASMQAIKAGMDEAGMLPNYTILLTESRLDARASVLTANTESVYALAWLSLKGGPIAVAAPPGASGFFTDAWGRHLAYTGRAGPDRGKGGLYVVAPPGYTGYVPQTKYAIRSRTFGVWVVFRAPMVRGATKWAVQNFKKRLEIYPLKEAKRPPPNWFVDISGKPLQTIHANDLRFFESIHALVQDEPAESQDPELLGVLASIGIEKNRRFEPDARMKAILEEAAAVGSVTTRALLFRGGQSETLDPGSQWQGLQEDDPRWERASSTTLDTRAALHYYATEPSAPAELGARGTQRAVSFRDGEGRFLDGAKTYALRLPPEVSAVSWSVVLYDNQTRSMLQTDQRFPSLSNERRVPIGRDGSITLYFGPKPPRKKKASWIQTIPGKGYSVVLHLDRPGERWFDGTWRPENIEWIEEIPSAPPRRKKPRMATEASTSIVMRDRIPTRLGTLELVDGVPTKDTSELLVENLRFMRGVETFVTMLPGASMLAMRRGLREAGVERNGVLGVFDRGVDAHSLLLTAEADSVLAASWLDLREGATIVESPSKTIGTARDFSFRRITDFGSAGPDEGKGGLFLFVPERYDGQLSERYFAFRSPTHGNLLTWRAPMVAGDPIPTVARLQQTLRIYPFDVDLDVDLEENVEENVEEEGTPFVSLSGKAMNTIPANDLGFYEDVAELIREEPAEAFSPELLALLAAIGIERTEGFAPDPSMRRLLAEAVQVGNVTARALVFRPRAPTAPVYEGSAWYPALAAGSGDFEKNGVSALDARTAFHFLATMPGSEMSKKRAKRGPQAVFSATDSEGRYLDGARSYRLILPKDVPVSESWSIVLYDPQTRSMLQAPGSASPTLSSQRGAIANEDGSTTIFFGPRPPEGASRNWIQTVPGKGWFAIFRLYGALDPWFDRWWRPGEIELID